MPAPLAGDTLVICRLVGAKVNNGLDVSELVLVVSALPSAPLTALPKNRLLVIVGPLALSAPADPVPTVDPAPPKPELKAKILLATVMPENDVIAQAVPLPPLPVHPSPLPTAPLAAELLQNVLFTILPEPDT